jgi:hypothetical protein
MNSFAKQLTGLLLLLPVLHNSRDQLLHLPKFITDKQFHSFQNMKVPCCNLQLKSAHAKFPVPHFVIQISVTNTNLCLFDFLTDVT